MILVFYIYSIVFLSVVRSADPSNSSNFRSPNGVFGHLNSDQRLCVSMSRQKKILIVVGDGDLMESEYARKHCGHLYAFLELCRHSPDGYIHRGLDSLLEEE